MKKIIFRSLIGFQILFFISCASKQGAYDVHLELEPLYVTTSDPNLGTEGLIKVMTARLLAFNISEDKFEITSQNGIIHIQITGTDYPESFESLLVTKGAYSFWETYNYTEIVQYIERADSFTLHTPQLELRDLTYLKDDTLFPLTYFLVPYYTAPGNLDGPVAGVAKVEHKQIIDTYLDVCSDFFPVDCVFMWTEPDHSDYADSTLIYLIALKATRASREPSISSGIAKAQAIQSPSTMWEIQIEMDDETSVMWKKMTSYNVNRSIAFVLDDIVLMYPVVMQTIEGGKSNISGHFGEPEARVIAGILSSGPLPIDVMVKNVKITQRNSK